MNIRYYNDSDTLSIINLGKKLHNNYNFDLNEYSNCLVIENDNQIIGFISYQVLYDSCEILDIIIDQKYRGNGYSKLLLEKLFVILDNINYKNITLEVNINNTIAINLYKSFGFKIIAIRKNYYNNINAYLMEKKAG